MDMTRIHEYQKKFVADRDWQVYHTPKNLACAMAVEAGELLEIFQWLRDDEVPAFVARPEKREEVSDELADVFYYLTRLADLLQVDLEAAFWSKVAKNEKKYPVELARGNAKKYSEFTKD